MTVLRIVLVSSVIAFLHAGPAAPTDFSGVYTPNLVLSKALTESKGLPFRMGGTGGGATSDLSKAIGPTVTITQTATTVTFEERLDDYHKRTVLKLDGSESVNTSSIGTERSRTVWKGAHLVTTGTRFLEVQGGQMIIERPFVTTRIRAPNGDIHVEQRTSFPERQGETLVTWSVLERQRTTTGGAR